MKRKIVTVVSALALALSALVLGTASPAMADSNWGYPVYDERGNYAGCISKFTGHFFSPSQITELGCNTDLPLAD